MHPQEHRAVSLHLRYPVYPRPGGGVRGELSEGLLHHLQAAGLQRDVATGQGEVQDCVPVRLHHQVRGEAARQICSGYQV